MIQELYNHLAQQYDETMREFDRLDLFPYAHYEETLNEVANYLLSSTHKQNPTILDLGIGTANLYAKINPSVWNVDGVDFSQNMLEIAKLKAPGVHYHTYDFLKGVPVELQNKKFDFIVSTYCIRHLSLEALVDFIHHYLTYLEPFGKLILADTIFIDEFTKKLAFQKNNETWNHEEHYHVYSQLVNRIKEHLGLSFAQIGESSGFIVVENVHEYTLQYEENLIQYKTNTAKWKSTSARKKRE